MDLYVYLFIWKFLIVANIKNNIWLIFLKQKILIINDWLRVILIEPIISNWTWTTFDTKLWRTRPEASFCYWEIVFYFLCFLVSWFPSLTDWLLNHFMPLISFDTPWKQKTRGVSKEISGRKWVNEKEMSNTK